MDVELVDKRMNGFTTTIQFSSLANPAASGEECARYRGSTVREPKDKEGSDLRGSAGQTEQMAKDAGIDVVAGYSEVSNKYPMMNKVDTLRTKLVFNRDNRKIVGGSVLRKCVSAQ